MENKEVIERLVDQALKSNGLEECHGILKCIRLFLYPQPTVIQVGFDSVMSGEIINVIKELRMADNRGLKEAKEAVEKGGIVLQTEHRTRAMDFYNRIKTRVIGIRIAGLTDAEKVLYLKS